MEKEFNEINQNAVKEVVNLSENTAENKPKVSTPIFTQNNGFYRYNYEKERLEFINNQTRIVAAFWSIPSDQWEDIPSQEEYCRNITERANKQQEESKGAGAIFISGILAFFIGLFGSMMSGIPDKYATNGNMWLLISFGLGIVIAVISYIVIYNILKLFYKK